MKINLNKEILRLAAPAIINNVTVPLLGISDTAISGHLGGARFLGAIAVGSMMLNVFFWLAGFLRMGTTGLTARAYGAESREGLKYVLGKALIIAALISLIVITFQRPIENLLLSYLHPEPATEILCREYFGICIWGVPAQLVVMAVTGWFIGIQTTVVPMIISIATNVINIVMSVTLAFPAGYGFHGIAVGTVVANWLAAIGGIIWIWNTLKRQGKTMGQIHDASSGTGLKNTSGPKEEEGSEKETRWSDFFKVNGSLFIRSACIMAVTLSVTSVGASLGEDILAANAVIMQFFMFFSYFMDGFAFSGEALTGRFSGAGDMGMVKETVKYLLVWGVVMSVLFFMIYWRFTPSIAGLLTDNGEVLATISRYQLWIELLPPLTVMAFIFDGIYVGLTRTAMMMWATIAGAGCFFGLIHIPDITLTNSLLWIAFESYLFVRGGSLGLIYMFRGRK